MKSSRKRMTRLLAFGPAFVMICVTAYVASGASVVGSASAVSTAGVTGTVATAGSTDPDVTDATCTGENSVSGEALAATWTSTLQTTDGCKLSFWTNNATGATINYSDTFGAAAAAFFCIDPTPGTGTPGDRDCSTDAKRADDVPAGGAIGNASDKFGIALTSLGGGAVNGTGATGTPVASPATTDAVWYPISATAELCKTTVSNTSGTPADCTFKLGGSGEATQGAGTYYGNATLTITQNP
jgi:hypothetical protein